jgi:hypothetical protein
MLLLLRSAALCMVMLTEEPNVFVCSRLLPMIETIQRDVHACVRVCSFACIA